MSRFAIVTWDGGGNQPPAIGIGHELRKRGHEVRVLGYESQRARFERYGLEFTTLARSGGVDWQRTPPNERISTMLRGAMACPEHLDDVPEVLAAHPADLVLVDYLMIGALAAVEKLRLPAVALVHSALAFMFEAASTPAGPVRLAAANELRTRAGLSAVDSLPGTWSHLPAIVTTIPELDTSAAGAPSTTLYVGPIAEPSSETSWTSPWSADDSRPIALVSFTTTTAWDQTGRIRNTLEALRESHLRVLVTAATPDVFEPLPANAAVRQFVPHPMVLPEAAVTITHAGHGTITASLAYGVPLVCLPNPMADQPYLAQRVQELGAGIALAGDAPPYAIRRAVEEVVATDTYRDAAAHLAEAIRASSGASGAAAMLERQVAAATER
jgi:UDP:flavonoid glycosyltransferase YjiC (YdhE family)